MRFWRSRFGERAPMLRAPGSRFALHLPHPSLSLSPSLSLLSLTWYGVTELKLFSATHQAAAMAAGTPTTRAAAAAALRADDEMVWVAGGGASPAPPLVLASADGGAAGGGAAGMSLIGPGLL
jgi:hypothetical protein